MFLAQTTQGIIQMKIIRGIWPSSTKCAFYPHCVALCIDQVNDLEG